MVAKIVSRSELLSIRESLRESGKRVVFTNGCFDLLHRGHVEMLMEARSCGDVLFVGLNSDKGVRALKGPTRPLFGEEDSVLLSPGMRLICLYF